MANATKTVWSRGEFRVANPTRHALRQTTKGKSNVGLCGLLLTFGIGATPVLGQTFECEIVQAEGELAGARVPIPWPGGVVPVYFNANVNPLNRQRARDAMAEIEFVADISFVEIGQRLGDFIEILSSTGNRSAIGMQHGGQLVEIANWDQPIVIVHELMHALGFYHEHQRPDRENFVRINDGQIQPGWHSQFEIQPFATEVTPYDFESVMHYPGCAVSVCCEPGKSCDCPSHCETITARPPYEDSQPVMGQRDRLSQFDILALQSMYGSNGSCPGDITDDGRIDLRDVAALQNGFGEGPSATRPKGDVDGDGYVDHQDMKFVTRSFGNCTSGADLYVAGLITPASVGPGQQFNIDGEIGNIGDVQSTGRVSVTAWLSIDGDPFNGNGDDIFLGEVCDLNVTLEPGEQVPFRINSLPVPPTAALGLQRIVVCVDTFGGACGGVPPCSWVCETDEFNNCASHNVLVRLPDLVMTNTTSAATACIGSSIPICGRITNVGQVPSFGAVQVGAWLSLDGNPFNGNGDDIPMGGLCSVDVDLAPGASTNFCFNSLFVPPNAAPTLQDLVLCADTTGGPCGGAPPCAWVCEANELNNCDIKAIEINGPDAAVVDLSFPSTVLSPNLAPVLPTPVTVTIENRGCTLVDIPVNVCIGPNCAPTAWFENVVPGGHRTGTVYVIPPLTGLNCGGAESVPVTACASLAFDVARGNDCRTEHISVVEQYWDLRLEIVSGPSSAIRNPCHLLPRLVSWTVRVTNVGNFASPNFSSSPCLLQTGIVPQPGQGAWGSPLDGLRFSGIPSLQPITASSGLRQFDFTVTGYRILCGAFLGTQYIKAEFFCDQCNPGQNNYARKSVQIRLP